MTPAEGAQAPEIFASEIGTYWFDPSGILISKSNRTRRNMANMRANIAMLKRISGGTPVCLIVHLTFSPKPDKETLEYVAQELPNVYKAMAMVTTSGLGKLIMSILFRFKPAPIPMKVFSNEADAKAWISRFL
jgi:hypothetical protein